MKGLTELVLLLRTILRYANRDFKSFAFVVLVLFTSAVIYFSFTNKDCSKDVALYEANEVFLRNEIDSLKKTIIKERSTYEANIERLKSEQAEVLERVINFISKK